MTMPLKNAYVHLYICGDDTPPHSTMRAALQLTLLSAMLHLAACELARLAPPAASADDDKQLVALLPVRVTAVLTFLASTGRLSAVLNWLMRESSDSRCDSLPQRDDCSRCRSEGAGLLGPCFLGRQRLPCVLSEASSKIRQRCPPAAAHAVGPRT